MKWGKRRVKYVQLVLIVLLLELHLHPFVKHVRVALTVRLLAHQLLVKLAMQENTRTKSVKHRANHVQAGLTVLLVRQIVHIRQLLVLLAHTQQEVEQHVSHVKMVRSVLLVHQVVFRQLLVQLVCMLVEHQSFVISVVLENTMIKQIKLLNRLLVKVA